MCLLGLAESRSSTPRCALWRRTALVSGRLDPADIELARELHDRHPRLSARDLCYLASCRRRGITEIVTFDRSLREAFLAEGR